MKLKLIAVTCAITLAAFGLQAKPEKGMGMGMMKGACKEDRMKFCKDVKQGDGRIVKCLKEHESELSQSCKDQRAMAKKEMGAAHQACADDVTKFCSEVEPGGGRIKACMKEHSSELSEACRKAHKNMK